MSLNLLAASEMSFNKLNTEVYIAFALAIVFTILTVSASLYYLRNQKKVGKKMEVIFTIIVPFMTCFLWAYTILDICMTNSIISFFISLGIIIVMFLLFFGIGKIRQKNSAASENTNEGDTINYEEAPATVAQEIENNQDDKKLLN